MRASILETISVQPKFRSVLKLENWRTTLAEGFLRKEEKVNKRFSQREREKQVSVGLQDCEELEPAFLLEDRYNAGVTPIGKDLFC